MVFALIAIGSAAMIVGLWLLRSRGHRRCSSLREVNSSVCLARFENGQWTRINLHPKQRFTTPFWRQDGVESPKFVPPRPLPRAEEGDEVWWNDSHGLSRGYQLRRANSKKRGRRQ